MEIAINRHVIFSGVGRKIISRLYNKRFVLAKLFETSNIKIVKECQQLLNINLPSVQGTRLCKTFDVKHRESNKNSVTFCAYLSYPSRPVSFTYALTFVFVICGVFFVYFA